MRTGNLTPSASGYVNVGTESTAYASGVFDNIKSGEINVVEVNAGDVYVAGNVYASGVKLDGSGGALGTYSSEATSGTATTDGFLVGHSQCTTWPSYDTVTVDGVIRWKGMGVSSQIAAGFCVPVAKGMAWSSSLTAPYSIYWIPMG
jgi:hypothetical protein